MPPTLRNLDPGFIAETTFLGDLIRLVEPPVRFQVEEYVDVIDELKEIYPEHWAEIALNKDAIPLDPDYDRYADLARSGAVHVVTARAGRTLAGYHISFIVPHLHYRSSLTCFTDIFYLRKQYRTGMTGYKMLKFFRDSVKARGVQRVYMMTKLTIDLDPILKRLGFKAIERVYSMVFKWQEP